MQLFAVSILFAKIRFLFGITIIATISCEIMAKRKLRYLARKLFLLEKMKISRGLKNNNPLNIRRNKTKWQGLAEKQNDCAFFTFVSPVWGYRAAFVTLRNYKKVHGIQTIAKWVARWAPPVENDTAAYIAFVSRKAEISPDVPVDINNKESMCRIVAAMSHMENGVPANAADVERGWELAL